MNANAHYKQKGQHRRASEKQEQAAIVQLLESIGAKVYVLGVRRKKGDYQGTMQTPGLPDLYCVLTKFNGGRFTDTIHSLVHVWIEVKAKGGRLSKAQEQFQQHCVDAAVQHVIGTCDDVQNWLVDHGWLKADQRRSA